MLSSLTDPVKLLFFEAGEPASELRQLLTELVELADILHLESKDYDRDRETAARLHIDKAPALLLLDKEERDCGIRFYGTPAGYEFSALLEAVRMVSHGDSGLTAESRRSLATLREPVKLQVFVTLSCPYCPGTVRLAHQLACEREEITAEMIAVQTFPELAERHQVRGVPRTVVNGVDYIDSPLSETSFLQRIIELAGLE